MCEKENVIGYLKFKGDYIKDGMFDARKSAHALLGFDEILRYFIKKELPELNKVEFDFPVKVQEGSFNIVIDKDVLDFIIVYGLPGLTSTVAALTIKDYLSALAKKSATDGIFETGPVKDIKKVITFSMKIFQWIVRISQIRKQLNEKDIDGMKPKVDSKTVEIPYSEDKERYLNVPIIAYEEYLRFPKHLFQDVVNIIDEKTEMEVGVVDDAEERKWMKTKVTYEEKGIFCDEKNDEDEVVLPELVDGEYVSLEGQITRGNEQSNTLGFKYEDHVITCKPKKGKITDHKRSIISSLEDHLFPKVVLKGVVDRQTRRGEYKDKKPWIIFDSIEVVEEKEENLQVDLESYVGKD